MNNNKDNRRYKSGLLGEELALKELQKLGFSLVEHRYKTKSGEIDLIVKSNEKKMIVFVEVKRRKEVYDYDCVVSKPQWKRILEASEEFLQQHWDEYKDFQVRFDEFIFFTNNSNFHHIENIIPDE